MARAVPVHNNLQALSVARVSSKACGEEEMKGLASRIEVKWCFRVELQIAVDGAAGVAAALDV